MHCQLYYGCIFDSLNKFIYPFYVNGFFFVSGYLFFRKAHDALSKTQYSLSDDPKNLLCDEEFNLHITSVEYKAGAEFVVVKTGKIMTMPGLPKVPAAEKIDLNENNEIVGIF